MPDQLFMKSTPCAGIGCRAAFVTRRLNFIILSTEDKNIGQKLKLRLHNRVQLKL